MRDSRITPLRILAALVFCTEIIAPTIKPAQAEPYMALRTGFKCSQCHVNRTGGGKRNNFGVIYSQTVLAMKPIRSASFFDGRLNRSISVGSNLRIDNISLLRYTSPEGEEGEPTTNSRIPEANLYLSVGLIPDVLTAYVDQTLAPGTENREFFGLIQFKRLNSYLKVGRMLLPYGLRLRDDDAFIRARTGFTYSKHDLGIELGFEPGITSVMANLTRNQVSVIGQILFRRFRIGGSFSQNIRGSIDYKMGVFAGLNIGRFTLADEGDFMRFGNREQFAGFVELYFLPMRGFNVRAAYEFFDRRRDVDNTLDGQDRITFGIEPFITQFLQIGVSYRINRFIPQNVPLNQDQLMFQFHIFF